MKFKLVKTEFVEIDMDAERKRIEGCEFSDEQRKRLLKLCDMFEQGKYKECDEFMDSWGKCPELECPEVEFVWPDLRRIVIGALYWQDTTIERVKEKKPRKKRKRKLDTPEEIEQVCYLYHLTESNQSEIARHFNVSLGVIARVLDENSKAYTEEHEEEIEEFWSKR